MFFYKYLKPGQNVSSGMNLPKGLTAATGITAPGEIIMAAADSHLTIKYYSLLITKKKKNLGIFYECWKLVNVMLAREMFIPSFLSFIL